MRTGLFSLALRFDSLDHKGILQWLAINMPTAFQRGCEAVGVGCTPGWMQELSEAYGPHKGLVPLIKHIRQNTRLGLMEAMLVARRRTNTENDDQAWRCRNDPEAQRVLRLLAAHGIREI